MDSIIISANGLTSNKRLHVTPLRLASLGFAGHVSLIR